MQHAEAGCAVVFVVSIRTRHNINGTTGMMFFAPLTLVHAAVFWLREVNNSGRMFRGYPGQGAHQQIQHDVPEPLVPFCTHITVHPCF